MWTGLIDVMEDEIPFLLKLGVAVHSWSRTRCEAYVTLNRAALTALEPYMDIYPIRNLKNIDHEIKRARKQLR